MSRSFPLPRPQGMGTKRVVILGGGFAGVHAAAGAAATGAGAVTVELVSPNPHLVIKPRLYEPDLAGVRVPLAALLDPIAVHHSQAAATTIDTVARTVALDDGGELDYDQLILAAGSRLTAPDGVHCADSYEQAQALNAAVSAGATSAAIVGGGFTGLELAAELAGRVPRVELIEAGPHVAPGYGPRGIARIDAALTGLGVVARTGTRVDDPAELDADLVVWATGPRASALCERIPGERDRSGRLLVDATLRTAADSVWAAGDCAAADVDGQHLSAMSCQHAVPQGRHAGENAARVALGQPARRYRQPLYLTCLALGGYGALVTCGFERDTVLAAGAQAAPLKRFINRSGIYPPIDPDARQILKLGTPAPPGRAAAAGLRLALHSAVLRRAVTGSAPDRAAQWAAREQELVHG